MGGGLGYAYLVLYSAPLGVSHSIGSIRSLKGTGLRGWIVLVVWSESRFLDAVCRAGRRLKNQFCGPCVYRPSPTTNVHFLRLLLEAS